MRIARKPVLERAGDWEPELHQGMAWTGYGFQFVPDIAGCGVELDDELLLAGLDVHGSGGINEAKPVRGVHHSNDAAEVERPESEGVDFHGDYLSSLDGCLRIGYAHPANVKGRPSLEGPLCILEHIRSLTKQGTRQVMSEAAQ